MSEMLKELAVLFADQRTTEVLLNHCAPEILDGKVWRDTTRARPEHNIASAVKYMQLRGLIEHHPKLHHLVAIKAQEKPPEGVNYENMLQ